MSSSRRSTRPPAERPRSAGPSSYERREDPVTASPFALAREAERGGRSAEAALLLVDASIAALREERPADAAAYVTEAERLADVSGNANARGAAHVARARLEYLSGDPGAALRAVERAWSELRDGGAPQHRLDCMTMFGVALSDLGLFEAAMEWDLKTFAEASVFAATEAPGSLLRFARAHTNLAARCVDRGEALMAQGEVAEARALFERAASLSQEARRRNSELGAAASVAINCGNLGLALAYLGRFEEAEAALAEGDRARGDRKTNNDWINARIHHARLCLCRGDLAGADAWLASALADAEARGILRMVSECYAMAAEVAERRGDLAGALANHKRFHRADKRLTQAGTEQRARTMAVRMRTEHAEAEAIRLRRVSREDPLTGLANRRALDEWLTASHLRARREQRPLCASLVDVDFFKRVNDRFSHAVGDAVLRRVAELLRGISRAGDLVARYGGEEFVLAVVDCDLHVASRVCERARAAIEGDDWGLIAPGLAVTASFGLCDLAESEGPDGGLACADAALYRAKAGGRNQVVVTSQRPRASTSLRPSR
jgi:diguanylate cyclase (GGDEF)-like protein